MMTKPAPLTVGALNKRRRHQTMARWKTAAIFLTLGVLVGVLGTSQLPLGKADPQSAGTPAASQPRDLHSYRDVVKKVLPAVVYVEATSKATARRRPTDDTDTSPFDGNLRRFLEEQRRMMPRSDQAGSGAIIDAKGIVITNNHVVSGADQVEVTLKDGRKFTSKSIHTDPKTDLAVVKIEAASPLPYIELGDSDAMEIGDRVLAVGAPFGLAGSVTQGIVSAKGRNLNLNNYSLYEDYLQTDAAINPGNSGGPLVNLDGKIIGINTAIKSQNGGFQGVGLAIPSNMVRAVVTQLANDGVVRRGYLGIQMQDVDDQLADKLKLGEQRGVVVMETYANAPAAKAGIKEMDVITAVNGRPITTGRDLQRSVFSAEIGKPVELTVLRDGKVEKLKVAIEQQPEDYGLVKSERARRPSRDSTVESISLDKIGIEVAELTSDLADQLGYKDVKGVVITRVERGSIAELAGLRSGTLIMKAEKKTVDTPDALKGIVEKASLNDGILLMIRTPTGGTRYIVLKAS
jgi:serine protease Do